MRNSMQMRQGEEGNIWPLGPISLPGKEMQRSQRREKEVLEKKIRTDIRSLSDFTLPEWVR